ncbi:MAG: hypothetical protein K2K84_09000, partial [Muribaculaceae bacterium]|nr:hypothetical protein [Muribaculaceae bacterium]
MNSIKPIYLNTPIAVLIKDGVIDRNIARACEAANPPLLTAGDIRRHWLDHGAFTEVPGCRRPGRISRALTSLANMTLDEDAPAALTEATLSDTAAFPFLTAEEQATALKFKEEYGHLPMFYILSRRLGLSESDRKAVIFGSATGLLDKPAASLAEIAAKYDISPERVRQIIQDFALEDILTQARLWKSYADYSVYFINKNSEVFNTVVAKECPNLTFRGFSAIIRRVLNFDVVDNTFMARRGWAPEIEAWVKRLRQLRDMP